MNNYLLASSGGGGDKRISHILRGGGPASILLWLVALLTLAIPAPIYAQTNIINSLDPAELNTALQAGGTVTFSTNGTIVLTNTITLSNNVILDGTNHSITISGGGTVELFDVPGGVSLTLRNLTVADGVTNGEGVNFIGMTYPANGYGGAIFTQGTLVLENCTFTNNRVSGGIGEAGTEEAGASGFGGAIYSTGQLSISNSSFLDNAASGGSGTGDLYGAGGSGYGGAIYNGGGTVKLQSVSFSNNSSGGGGATGGAFGNNSGSAYGGALYSSGGSLEANNLVLLENSAAGAAGSVDEFGGGGSGGTGQGGGFYLLGTAVAVSNSVFSKNGAAGGYSSGGAGGIAVGGGIVSTGDLLLWNCEFGGNEAEGASGSSAYGGGIYNTGIFEMEGTSVSNCQAIGGVFYAASLYQAPGDGAGGAIYNTGSLEMQGATVSQNQAVGPISESPYGAALYGNAWGGAIYNTGFVQLSSTILSSNTTSGRTNFGEEIYNTGVIQSDSDSTLMPYVIGTPPLSYQWQDSGSNLVGATNSTFDLGSILFAEAVTYNLVISNAGGLVTNFTEIINLPPPPLSISGISPDAGLTNGGALVSISGTGFTNGATVYFGNALASSVNVLSATNITAYTPAVAAAGVVNVMVINADFQPVVLTNGFTYVAPASLSSPQVGAAVMSNNAAFTMNVGGAAIPGWSFIVEGSSNLVNWQPLQTNASPFTFIDTNATSRPLRFYRAVQTP